MDFNVIESYVRKFLIEVSPERENLGKTTAHHEMLHMEVFEIDQELNKQVLTDDFVETLNQMMIKYQKTDVEIYTKIIMEPSNFNRYRSGKRPISKKNVLKMIIGIGCNLEDAKRLLASAGYTLTQHAIGDLVVKIHIEKGEYDPVSIDLYLKTKKLPCLFTTSE